MKTLKLIREIFLEYAIPYFGVLWYICYLFTFETHYLILSQIFVCGAILENNISRPVTVDKIILVSSSEDLEEEELH